jgi:hypothetical protein
MALFQEGSVRQHHVACAEHRPGIHGPAQDHAGLAPGVQQNGGRRAQGSWVASIRSAVRASSGRTG